MRSVLIAAQLYTASFGLKVAQQIITEPHLYSVNEDGICFDNNGAMVQRQTDCCNVDEERDELFKVFCDDTIIDEICAKFVYHIETGICDRAAIDRTKYYTSSSFNFIVGEPDYTSSFSEASRGQCCIAVDDFVDNANACEDPEEQITIELIYNGELNTCTRSTTTIIGRKVAVISGEEVIVVEGETIGPVDEVVDNDVCCLNELSQGPGIEALASPTACVETAIFVADLYEWEGDQCLVSGYNALSYDTREPQSEYEAIIA